MNEKAFKQEIRKLAKKIDYQPDIIIGIVRGGIIPARILSSFLNVKDMFCLTVKKDKDKRKVVTDILEDLSDKKILLVEDILETGKSLIVAKRYLESKKAKVKTACFYIMPISEITPDFYLKEINEVEKFPWEEINGIQY